MSETGEKTEEASDKKLEDARKEGNVWQSKDLSSVFAFAAAMAVVSFTWSRFERKIREQLEFAVEYAAHPGDFHVAAGQHLMIAVQDLMMICLPIVLAGAIAGGFAAFLQVGPLLALKAVMPKFQNINPITGLKNMVGKKQLVEFVKSLFKLGVTAWVVYGVLRDSMKLVVTTILADAPVTLMVIGELVFQVCKKVVLLFVGFAIFDIWWQRKSYMKDQMMSKEDVKKEYKESEGDPHNKAKRKEMAMEILESAQMNAVKGADVVVTNPEHVAVALQYDREKDGAPRVVAKGIDSRAASIRELAKVNGVPMMRNVPLAHALLRVEINQEVPEELYDAVAEVLNFVYQLKTASTLA